MEFNNVVSIIACIYQRRKARNKKWSSHKAKRKTTINYFKIRKYFYTFGRNGALLKERKLRNYEVIDGWFKYEIIITSECKNHTQTRKTESVKM